MIAARQIFLGRGGAKKDPMAVVGSVYGDGSTRCIFTKAFTSPVPSLTNAGLTFTCWAKFPSNTHGSFFNIGSDRTGFGIGHGASSGNYLNEIDGNYINGLANARWWLPTSTVVGDGNWHHYAVSSSVYQAARIYVDGAKVATAPISSWGTTSMNGLSTSSHITILGACDGPWDNSLTGYVTRVCLYFNDKSDSFIASDYALRLNAPDMNGLAHYYNGTEENGDLKDMVGTMNLVAYNGAQFSTEVMS